MRKTELRQAIEMLRAMAEPTRLRILRALRQGEWCVCELAYALEVAQSTLSTHLQLLHQVGLVATRRRSKWVYYRLHPDATPLVDALLASLQDALTDDPRIVRDVARLQRCLQYRVNGCCVIGFRFTSIPNEGGNGTCAPADCCG